MIYYGKLKEQPEDIARYTHIKNDWVFETFGNPCILTKKDIPDCLPLKQINRVAYDVLVATLKHDSPMLYYDTQRMIVWGSENKPTTTSDDDKSD